MAWTNGLCGHWLGPRVGGDIDLDQGREGTLTCTKGGRGHLLRP